jgi:hypothetical protein
VSSHRGLLLKAITFVKKIFAFCVTKLRYTACAKKFEPKWVADISKDVGTQLSGIFHKCVSYSLTVDE